MYILYGHAFMRMRNCLIAGAEVFDLCDLSRKWELDAYRNKTVHVLWHWTNIRKPFIS